MEKPIHRRPPALATAGSARQRSSRPVVVGIVNVTTDSFSDGGLFLDYDKAIEFGQRLSCDGADIIDVGGESTRPGAHRIDSEMERQRTTPVVQALAACGLTVSIDTMRAATAQAALDAGATIVNDVSGGAADPAILPVAAAYGAELVLGHWNRKAAGRCTGVSERRAFVRGVREDLMRAVVTAIDAGVEPAKIIVDPGLGFAKDARDNWALLGALPDLMNTGYRVMIGASRKRFLGSLLADTRGDRQVLDRDTATATISALAATQGVWGVRVHDVRSTRDAIAVAAEWTSSAGSRSHHEQARCHVSTT